jgi:hypothetical protein
MKIRSYKLIMCPSVSMNRTCALVEYVLLQVRHHTLKLMGYPVVCSRRQDFVLVAYQAVVHEG